MTPLLFFRKIIVVFLFQYTTKTPFVILFSTVNISKCISAKVMCQDQVIWTSIHWNEWRYQYKSQLNSKNLIPSIYLSVTLLTLVVTGKTTKMKIEP